MGGPGSCESASGPPGNGELADLPPERSGPQCLCAAHRWTIEQKPAAGLSLRRIHQDLKSKHGFACSHHSVCRFAVRLGQRTPLPHRRMECAPGEEAQIDFGAGAWVVVTKKGAGA